MCELCNVYAKIEDVTEVLLDDPTNEELLDELDSLNKQKRLLE